MIRIHALEAAPDHNHDPKHNLKKKKKKKERDKKS